jgi:uncharacterized membrane protein
MNEIQTVSPPTDDVREEDKIHLMLSYLGPLALIPLLTVKDSDFVRWHAKQGLILGVGGALVLSLLFAIPFIGWVFGCMAWVAWVTVDILAMIKAMRGERYRIPLVTALAEKL